MRRSLTISAGLALLLATVVSGQSRTRPFGRSADSWCGDIGYSRDEVRHCQVRETTMGGANPIEVDAGRNGGIRVRGSDRSDVFVRGRIVASADSEAAARAVASAVRIATDGGRVRAEGPEPGDGEHWSISFEIEVPRSGQVALTTHNGGISLDDFYGTATFTARNGGVSLSNVGGDIRGSTTNGGVTVDLAGTHWVGTGLDVETRNGGVRLMVPDGFSAELEVGTTNGGLQIEFPVTVQGTLRRHITTTLGSGGPRVRAITRNGGVTVRRKA